MATLDNKSIKSNLPATVKYINNSDKNLPPDSLANVAAYIRGEHSIEQIFSRGHNGCSHDPKLAIQQFRACEALYRQKKAGAREAGLSEGKKPIIAEHFFLSFPNNESVPYETQREIADKLCASPVLKDFYAISNCHWNTDNDHMHILVSNFSKDGKRKLSMGNAKRNTLRKELDRICVSYGLSIIDDPGLRWKDPERENFVRQAVGKVDVYVPVDYEQIYNPKYDFDRWMLEQIATGKVRVAEGRSKNYKCNQSDAYKRWVASQTVFIRERDNKSTQYEKAVLLHEDALERASRVYYFDREYKLSKNGKYYYAVRRYDDNGYHKPMLVLLIELLYLVMTNEELYYREKYPRALSKNGHEILDWGTNKEIQASYDAFCLQREHGVRTFAELNARIQVVGNDLADARKGYAYYQRTIEKGTDLDKALRAFHQLKDKDRTPEEELVFKEAYRIMAAHKCTTTVAINDFWTRLGYAERKVKDLEAQIENLKKDYRELKFIEGHIQDLQMSVEQFVWDNVGSHTLNDILGRAETAQKCQNTTFDNREKFL